MYVPLFVFWFLLAVVVSATYPDATMWLVAIWVTVKLLKTL